MLQLNSSASYNELADEFWTLYNAHISDISTVLEESIDKRGWDDSFFIDDDANEEPSATAEQYRVVLEDTRDAIVKIITRAVADCMRDAHVNRYNRDSITVELDAIPDFDVELIIRPKFND